MTSAKFIKVVVVSFLSCVSMVSSDGSQGLESYVCPSPKPPTEVAVSNDVMSTLVRSDDDYYHLSFTIIKDIEETPISHALFSAWLNDDFLHGSTLELTEIEKTVEAIVMVNKNYVSMIEYELDVMWTRYNAGGCSDTTSYRMNVDINHILNEQVSGSE